MTFNQLVCSRIKEVRVSLNMTQEAVAAELDIDVSNYCNLEKGNVKVSVDRLNHLSQIFKLPLVALLPITQSSTINNSHIDNSTSVANTNDYNDKELHDLVRQAMNMVLHTAELMGEIASSLKKV